jgi:cytosine/adenosine deaminase-related metal-dependent hydrolase
MRIFVSVIFAALALCGAQNTPPVERGTLRLHYVQKPIGYERYEIAREMDAMQAATIVPARAMKLDGELGTIERGKRADMVVLNANPLEQIRNIRSVRWTISGGRVYDVQALWKSVHFQP